VQKPGSLFEKKKSCISGVSNPNLHECRILTKKKQSADRTRT
jgi:hypothetical protein